MAADDPEDGEGGGDLEPLTLREKVTNKAFNKALDRRLNFYTALILGLIGLGVVRELFQLIDGSGEFSPIVFLGSLAIGVGAFEVIAYVARRLTRRED